MGKKKNSQQHLQQSMGSLVSKAAIAQLGPSIEDFTRKLVQELGSQLAIQTSNTMESLFSRVVVLENMLIDKLGITRDDLVNKVCDLEDAKQGYVHSDGPAERGSRARLEVSTKTSDQSNFGNTSRILINELGTGNTIGEALETAIIGMKAGETKEVPFGQNNEAIAKMMLSRVSLKIRKDEPKSEEPQETQDENQTQG